MLKARIIPILTFNGFGLVKTKQFKSPRMVGNAVQAAKLFNSRNVDELVFVDIFASQQKRKHNLRLIKEVIDQCMMPVSIGGAVSSIDDIQGLLKVGADKVVIKTKAIEDINFVKEAASIFGSQCITIAVDFYKDEKGNYKVHWFKDLDLTLGDFIQNCEKHNAGELIINSVDRDGMKNGFEIDAYKQALELTTLPVVAAGGGGNPKHYQDLFRETSIEAVASSSIFYFTQYTPNDIKRALRDVDVPVRLSEGYKPINNY